MTKLSSVYNTEMTTLSSLYNTEMTKSPFFRTDEFQPPRTVDGGRKILSTPTKSNRVDRTLLSTTAYIHETITENY